MAQFTEAEKWVHCIKRADNFEKRMRDGDRPSTFFFESGAGPFFLPAEAINEIERYYRKQKQLAQNELANL